MVGLIASVGKVESIVDKMGDDVATGGRLA